MVKPLLIRVSAMILTLACCGAQAEQYLKDNNEILGHWLLEFVANRLDAAKTDENRDWEFKADGTMISSGYNRVLKIDDKMSFKYKVEDGKIHLIDPGRPHKPQVYEVYEKNGNAMTLKGGSEGFYFFKKK